MSIIDTLITDRTESDVARIKSLNATAFKDMTFPDQRFWLHSEKAAAEFLDASDDTIETSDNQRLEIYTITPTQRKGAYNYTDLNRVSLAAVELTERFADKGYIIPQRVGKSDWKTADVPTKAQLEAYLYNVKALEGMLLNNRVELPDSMNRLNFQSANNIEQALVNVDNLLNHIGLGDLYAGEVFAGE